MPNWLSHSCVRPFESPDTMVRSGSTCSAHTSVLSPAWSCTLMRSLVRAEVAFHTRTVLSAPPHTTEPSSGNHATDRMRPERAGEGRRRRPRAARRTLLHVDRAAELQRALVDAEQLQAAVLAALRPPWAAAGGGGGGGRSGAAPQRATFPSAMRRGTTRRRRASRRTGADAPTPGATL